MINLENPRFTERTTINLRRSYCLPHICIIIIYGKFGGYACRKLLYFYLYNSQKLTCNLAITNMDIKEL